jgi:hypothetical protein
VTGLLNASVFSPCPSTVSCSPVERRTRRDRLFLYLLHIGTDFHRSGLSCNQHHRRCQIPTRSGCLYCRSPKMTNGRCTTQTMLPPVYHVLHHAGALLTFLFSMRTIRTSRRLPIHASGRCDDDHDGRTTTELLALASWRRNRRRPNTARTRLEESRP